jgi:5-methylthioadenosine/S-adenosylhomocysteine deaminase
MTGARGPRGSDDRFGRAYRTGIPTEIPAPPVAGPGRELAARAAVGEAFALRGCVLTPEGPVEDGYVVVDDDRRITAVEDRRPEGVRVHVTGGVILPGLIDLHGHPEFNIFAAWEPHVLFANRYRWRASPVYRQLVRDPQNRLLEALEPQVQLRYAEVRALVGGATAIQGASGRLRTSEEALVRNVDRRIFGRHRARSMIDLPSAGSRDMDTLRSILADIQTGEVTAFYIHLAEGRADDPRSGREFDRLVEFGALTPATVIIHGSALTVEQLGQVSDAGAKLVWSPQSNLRLYGETTRAADALALGVPVGLGADWLPSGSTSLLAELKVAARMLAQQGNPATARQLVEMVTAGAARIAGLGDQLGALLPGRPADLLVLERQRADPWANVVAADPSWVELVVVDGDLAYGRADWIVELTGATEGLEPLVAWGKPMLLDTSHRAHPSGPQPPTLTQLRADLIAHYPQVGPIFA